MLVQRFRNPYDEPLAVRYQVPLPADGAVSGYAFELGQKRIVGEVDRKQQARERFEREFIAGVVQRHHGRMAAAAKEFGIERTNLYRKIRQLGIARE